MWRRYLLSGLAAWLAMAAPASAFIAYVSNEKSNTVSVIDTDKWTVINTIKVGQRPRGIEFTRDGKFVMVAVGDDDTIQMIDAKTREVVDSLPSGPDPELFIQDADGKILYVANENDNTVTIIDLEKRVRLGDIQVGVEPEGMAISPDGKFLINTSETTNMAHFIDTATRQIVANVLVDARPRFAEFKRDGSELWVSSEIGGTVSIIDPAKRVVTGKITFTIPGLRREAIQPVGIGVTKDGKTAFMALGPANRVAVVDATSHAVTKVSAGRPKGLAHGLHPGRKIPAGDQRRFQRRFGDRCAAQKVIKTIQVGELPWGITMAQPSPQSTHPPPAGLRRGRPSPARRRRNSNTVDIRRQSFLWPKARAHRHQFQRRAGKLQALLGLNGAGKSTLFSLVTRLFGIQTGSISIFGHDISRAPGEALRQLGVVFQPRTLDLDLSLMQNLLYHAALHSISRKDARLRADDVLTRIGLADRAGGEGRDLSGGQMRRLEIARALLHRPRLLLLDEATVGLDVKARADILDHIPPSSSPSRASAVLSAQPPSVRRDHAGRRPRGAAPGADAGEISPPVRSAFSAEAGAADVNSAFMRLTGAAGVREPCPMSATTGSGSTRLFFCGISHLPQRHRDARGAALSEPARPLSFGAGAAARLAVRSSPPASTSCSACRSSRPTRPTFPTRSISRRA